MEVVSGADVAGDGYAEEIREYYTSGTHLGRLKTVKNPLYTSGSGNMHKTDFEYNSDGLVSKEIGPADTVSGSRPETVYAYNALQQVSSITDPLGALTSFTYDSLGRKTRTTHPDNSTEETLYGDRPVSMRDES